MKLYEVNYQKDTVFGDFYINVLARSYEHALELFRKKYDNKYEVISISNCYRNTIMPINEQLDTKIKPIKTEILKKHNNSLYSVEELLYVSLSLTKEEASFLSQYIDFNGEL